MHSIINHVLDTLVRSLLNDLPKSRFADSTHDFVCGGLDQFLEVRCAGHAASGIGLPERAAVTVRRESVLDAGDLCGHRTPGRVRGQGLREHRTAGVTVTQRDQFDRAGVDLGQGHGGLVGFRARRGEHALLQTARRDAFHDLGIDPTSSIGDMLADHNCDRIESDNEIPCTCEGHPY